MDNIKALAIVISLSSTGKKLFVVMKSKEKKNDDHCYCVVKQRNCIPVLSLAHVIFAASKR